MMREILFRGKRVDNGEWTEAKTSMCAKDVDGSEEAFYLGARNPMIQHDDKFGNIGILETDTSSPIFYKVISETVGQYTGLKDKNGKKIFEGDIVGVTNNYGFACGIILAECEIAKVVYNENCLCWYAVFDDGGDVALFEYDNPERIEVIGNIYDNPELLKGGAE